jgi:hypothetical protein
MEIVDPGHRYRLQNNKSPGFKTTLIFYKDTKINKGGYAGTTNQEVLRALIDRVKFLDAQVSHPANAEIIIHLRKALVLHEQRHLDRLVQRGDAVEDISVKSSGHFV